MAGATVRSFQSPDGPDHRLDARHEPRPPHLGVGLERKVLAGAVYAEVVGNRRLAADVRALAPSAGVSDQQVAAAASFASGDDLAPAVDDDATTRATMLLARAASSSPAGTDTTTVAACREGLTPPAIVELVNVLSVLQLLHRLTCFAFVDGADRQDRER